MDDIVLRARCRIQVSDPWYGSFISRFEWICDNNIKTIGVSINNDRIICCHYNIEWCSRFNDVKNEKSDDIGLLQMVAILKHEAEHIIRMHVLREKKEHSHEIMNIAQDWIINGAYSKRNIKNLPDDGEYMPHPNYTPANRLSVWKGIDLSFFLDDHSSEEVYEWLSKHMTVHDNMAELSNGKEYISNALDDHSLLNGCQVSNEELRHIVKDAIASSYGDMPDFVKVILQSIENPSVNWRHYLANIINRSLGGKRKTYSKINRKNNKFGVKGNSHHASITLVILVDLSSSAMFKYKLVNKFFAEIESLSSAYKIIVGQFNTGITSIGEYKKGDWKKIKIHCHGGTNFSGALLDLEKKGLVGKINIILTDGECPAPPKKDYPIIWVISNKQQYEIFKSDTNLKNCDFVYIT